MKRLTFGFNVEYICYLQCFCLYKYVFIVHYDILFQRQFILLQKPPQKLSLEHRQRPLHILPPRCFIHKRNRARIHLLKIWHFCLFAVAFSVRITPGKPPVLRQNYFLFEISGCLLLKPVGYIIYLIAFRKAILGAGFLSNRQNPANKLHSTSIRNQSSRPAF